MSVLTKNLKQGYTLIEAMIYVAILAVVTVILVGIIVSIMGVFNHLRVIQSVSLSAESSMERLSREIKSAEAVDLVGSLFGVSPGRLVLQGEDSEGDPVEHDFYVTNGRLWLSTNSGTPIDLLTDHASVESLVFSHLTGSSSDLVHIELALFDVRKPDLIYNFSTSATLRN